MKAGDREDCVWWAGWRMSVLGCFSLSSTKLLRYSAEKTLLTSCSRTAAIAGSQEASKQQEKLSQMDMDDQNWTAIQEEQR